jgi:DNA-binding NtrC family response regulator
MAGAQEIEKTKPTILIVEDDKDLLESYKQFFEDNMFDVDCTCTGSEAAEKIATKDYDLALIDIVLPDMRGTILLPKFRRTIPTTRKIIITGYVTLENVVDAINNGAKFFLSKPVKLDDLLEAANKQLEIRARELELFQKKFTALKQEHLESPKKRRPATGNQNH